MFITLTIIIMGSLILFKFLKKYLRSLYLSYQFPGPVSWPLVGNGLDFMNKTAAEGFEYVLKLSETYGELWRMWFGFNLTIIISNPQDIETILSSQVLIDKSFDYQMLSSWLNSGLLLSTGWLTTRTVALFGTTNTMIKVNFLIPGKKWHSRRKLITPAFHFKILEQYIEIFERQSDIFVKILSKYDRKEPVEFYSLASLYTLDVICETAMGTTVNAQRDSESTYVQAVKEESGIIQTRLFNFLLMNEFFFKFSSLRKREQKALSILHDFSNKVISQRRQDLAKKLESTTDQQNDDFGVKRKETFIDILLKSTVDGQPLSDEDIREEVDTFMFEGHDTTTSAITFILYNLAKHPAIQEKCVQEIIEVIGTDKTQSSQYSQLTRFSYLENVIKETLRLYPSVPLIGRSISEETNINGKIYPAGCDIVLHIYAMGRNSKYFKDPEQFRPERFEKDQILNTQTFSYVPFSAGPRNCIGQKFAMIEMKSITTKILQHFHVSLDATCEKPKLFAELILRPANKIYFNFSPREI